MISYWRREFQLPNLPFFYVLLAAGHTALLREAQYLGAGTISHTAFASAVDLGANGSEFLIPGHPPRKQVCALFHCPCYTLRGTICSPCILGARGALTTDQQMFCIQEVGRRLALINRALIYQEKIDYVGPRVIAERVAVTTVTDKKSGAVHTTVRIPFAVGTGGNLHLNGTGGCTTCCNGTTSVSPHSSNLGVRRSDPSSPVGLLDPAIGTGAKVYKTQTFVVDAATSVLTATIPSWQATSKVAEVQFLFDNFPQCAVYSGMLSGPDAYYAQVKHFGLVAESWRGNVTIEKIVV
jgi:hypothetical protein